MNAAACIDAALTRSSRHWVLAVSLKGLRFYLAQAHAAAPIQVLADGAGLVFGTIFRRARSAAATASPCATLNAEDAGRAIQSDGRYFIEEFWGHYLALLLDGAETKWVLRSPGCHQPCLGAIYREVRLYFSDLEDGAALGLLSLSINWDFVAAFCAYGRLSGAETGINEIRELGSGEYHRFSKVSEAYGFHWNPNDFARAALNASPHESRALLRETVLASMFSWAGQHQSIVQRLSGGIDSSIASACLKLAPSRPQVTCLNYHTRGTYGDERCYARAVAQEFGFPLIEYRYDSADSLSSMLKLGRTHSPAQYLTRDGSDVRELALARDVKASARFTGIFGDALFYMPPAAPTAADYLRSHGFDRRFLAVALEAAQIDRVSIWRILHEALHVIVTPPKTFIPGNFGNPEHSLLTDQARERVCHGLRFVHPWLHELRGVPSGKFALIATLSWNSAYFDPLLAPGDSVLVHPFLSEPLIELCLKLPSYTLLRDGWDRALAREAFAPELPEIVRSRISKGSPNLHLRERLSNNQEFIRDLLCEGVLVQQGILDRQRIRDCLPGQTQRSAASAMDLWSGVAAETWARAWS